MDSEKIIIKLRKASQNSIPSNEFKNTLLTKLDRELDLKKPKLTFNTLFMNKKLMLFATFLFFIAVISTGGIAGYLLLQEDKSDKFFTVSASERQRVLSNVIANNSEAALTSNSLKSTNNTPTYENAPNLANDSAVAMEEPSPDKLSAPGMLIAPPKEPETFAYTKTKIKYGPKVAECKSYGIADEAKEANSESYEYYFDNYKYFSKNFSKIDGVLQYYYINKSYENRSENIEYYGGNFAIKTVATYDTVSSTGTLAIPLIENEIGDDVNVEDQIKNIFGNDVIILKPENDDSYYVIEYQHEINCLIDSNENLDTLITRSYIKSDSFEIFKTQTYLNIVSKENLLDTTNIDSKEEKKDYSDVSDKFEFEYDVPIKEERITSFNPYNNVEKVKDETLKYLSENNLKILVPVKTFANETLYAPTAVTTKIERGLDTFEYKNLRDDRDFYPKGSYGDELYNNIIQSYLGTSQLLSYGFYDTNSSLNIEVYKDDVAIDELLKNLIGEVDSDSLNKSTLKITIDGKQFSVNVFEYTYENSIRPMPPSAEGAMPVEPPDCLTGSCGYTIQKINFVEFNGYFYKLDYYDYSNGLTNNTLSITEFKSLDSKNIDAKAQIEILIDNAYEDQPIPVDVLPPESGGIACTMDAMICPDGSAVGRNPENNCEFDPCP